MKTKLEHFFSSENAKWYILLILLLLYGMLMVLFYFSTRSYAINEAEKRFEDILFDHKAKHAYIEEMQKPAIYRLKKEGKLYPEFFAPEVLSFTFIARNMHAYHKKQLEANGKETYKYKLASSNPRNPLNQADAFEADLLKKFNSKALKEYMTLYEREGEEYLYKAIPIAPSQESCMQCHGDPADAPQDMLDIYGDKAGFYEKLGDIRAMISLEVPLKGQLHEAGHFYQLLAIMTTLAFIIIYAVILYLITVQRKLAELKQQREKELIEYQKTLTQTNEQLQELSLTDELTQLYNRRKFLEDMKYEMQRSSRYGYELSLMMFDLDYFKAINDKYGHDCGDKVLKRFAVLMQHSLRSSDRAYRIGGEEFAVIALKSDLKDSTTLAERIREAVESLEFEECESHKFTITISAGVSVYKNSESFSQLFKRVDEMLYEAKENGRNCIRASE